jgi:hypothetical protein
MPGLAKSAANTSIDAHSLIRFHMDHSVYVAPGRWFVDGNTRKEDASERAPS